MMEITDAMIAERCMGWESESRYCGLDGTRDVYVSTSNQFFIMYAQDWKPKLNISQAFQVVERMRNVLGDKFLFTLFSHKDGYGCTFMDGSYDVIADTPALAICEAAYRAKEDADG